MLQESLDLRAEADELRAFLETLGGEDWGRSTGFMKWTPWDVVAHLHFFDRVSLLALETGDAFDAKRDAFVEDIVGGLTSAEIARREFGDLGPAELLARWHATAIAASRNRTSRSPRARSPCCSRPRRRCSARRPASACSRSARRRPSRCF